MDVDGLYKPNKRLTEAPLPPSPLACLGWAAHGPRTCRAEHRSKGAAAKLAGMMGVQGMHGIFSEKVGENYEFLRVFRVFDGFCTPVSCKTTSYCGRTTKV